MADNYSVKFFENQFQGQVRNHQYALNPFETLALKYLKGEVLELGCGLGNLSLEAAKQGHRVVAVDASPTAVARVHAVQVHVIPGGCAIVNMLLAGTTYMGMFDLDNYCLFQPKELEERFAGWKILESHDQTFPAPEATRKEFSTVIAEKAK